MQSLHLVGFTEDGEGLMFATRKGARSGNFVVPIDDRLTDHLQAARRPAVAADEPQPVPGRPSARAPRADSALSPREMQARLRRGETVAEVAAAAGVEEDWVERFATPVFAEQAAAIAQAAVLYMHIPRRGMSHLALADAVQRSLTGKGARLSEEQFADAWSAHQHAGAEWVVRFGYRWRDRDQVAEWLVDLSGLTLEPRNRTATELGWVTLPVTDGVTGRVDESTAPPLAVPTSASRAGRTGGPAQASARAAQPAARPRPATGNPAGDAKPAGAKPARARKPATKRAVVAERAPAEEARSATGGAEVASLW